jgi:hypothetical protein
MSKGLNIGSRKGLTPLQGMTGYLSFQIDLGFIFTESESLQKYLQSI